MDIAFTVNGEARQVGARETASLLEVLRNRRLRPILALNFCNYACTFTVQGLWGGPFLREVHGLSPIAAGNVLLAGDAAGLINPLQGEGIGPGMVSARLAAECLLAGPGQAAAAYTEAVTAAFGADVLITDTTIEPTAGVRTIEINAAWKMAADSAPAVTGWRRSGWAASPLPNTACRRSCAARGCWAQAHRGPRARPARRSMQETQSTRPFRCRSPSPPKSP